MVVPSLPDPLQPAARRHPPPRRYPDPVEPLPCVQQEASSRYGDGRQRHFSKRVCHLDDRVGLLRAKRLHDLAAGSPTPLSCNQPLAGCELIAFAGRLGSLPA
jgi:hypothetical protein